MSKGLKKKPPQRKLKLKKVTRPSKPVAKHKGK